MAAVVQYARRHAPFYRDHFAGYDPARWRELPTIDKQLLMSRFTDANTCGISRDEALDIALAAEATRDFRPTVRGITVGLSSGTSGHRSLFLASRAEQAQWVGTILARLLPPVGVRGCTITLFSLSGSNLYGDLRGRWIRFYHHGVATSTEDAVRLVNAEQPDILCAPPLYLAALARRRRAGELRVSPQRVVSVADVLEPEVQRGLEAAFDCPIAQVYQCAEGLIAVTCEAGRLHVQEDLVATQFEPLPASPSSSPSRFTPIITDLWHRTQPIIRYRLNDTVTLSHERCACGSAFQVLGSVEGRNDDICEFIDTAGALRLVYPATIRQMVMTSSDAIVDWDAVQETRSHLRLRVQTVPGSDSALVTQRVRCSVTRGLERQGVQHPIVEVVAELPASTAVKRRRVRRLTLEKGDVLA